MVEFLELPIEILPAILGFLVKTSYLASAAKVNRVWNGFVTPRLYERVSIFSWHKDAKRNVRLLFTTLELCPRLAKYVRRLEIRDFPKAVYTSGLPITDTILRGLENCTNLLSCTWTRDGSLSSEILGTLTHLPYLRELEFNGHSQGQYDPKVICQFKGLEKVSVIMPSNAVISSMKEMQGVSGENLKSLTMICKSSPVVTDRILKDMATSLPNLEQFSITGCPKVTERGVFAIVSSTQAGLRTLALENVSTKFDIARFAELCTSTQALCLLSSVTLTVSQAITDPLSWTKSVIQLLSDSPLERFHMYATYVTGAASLVSGGPVGSTRYTHGPYTISNALVGFWKDLVVAHGDTLRRMSVMRMPINLVSIRDICAACPNLEELFAVAEPGSLDLLPESLALAKNLRTIHINFPVRPNLVTVESDDSAEYASDSDNGLEDGQRQEGSARTHPVVSPAEALALVKRCGPAVTQFGCNTRVWKVGRTTQREEDGTVSAEVVLLPYESPDIPEPFLVVRT